MARVILEKITKSFGKFRALHDVSMNFDEGAFHAILGPSGSGKTTILRIIAGFEDYDSGSIHVGNESMENVPVEKRNIGMVFQNYALFPNMNVKDNVIFGLKVRRIKGEAAEKKVKNALELVHMESMSNRKPNQLSGGQRQRVALARALVTSPKVLLLDEPFSALDKALRLEMQIELKRIQREVGITTIFVTHDQEEALTLSDRIGILNKGILVQEGDPKYVYNHPVSSFIATFLGDSNTFEASIDKGIIKIDDQRIYASNLNSQIDTKIIKVSIRAEKIKIFKQNEAIEDNFENSLNGEVIQSLFAGKSLTYIVRFGCNVIKVFQQNVSDGILKEGTPVKVLWKATDTIVLKS